MKEIIDLGITPEAKQYLSTFTREDNPYVVWHLVSNYPIPLYRYLGQDDLLIVEVIENIIELEDSIEIYKSISSNISFTYDSDFNWNIYDVYDDNIKFDDIILN